MRKHAVGAERDRVAFGATRVLELFVALALLSVSASAAESTPSSAKQARGPLILSEDFARPVPSIEAGLKYTLKTGWRVRSGQWDFTDGALRGHQMPTDGRGAFVIFPLRFVSAAIQFDVRLDDCRQMIFRIQDSIPEHICSVRINRAGFSSQKDDHDHKGEDQAVPFGTVALPMGPTEWKTVLVEIADGTMSATIDGKSIRGAHPLLRAEKSTIEFVVSGQTASFRNVRVWQIQGTDRRN